uniref:Porin n=1 Tax=uncultured bacterium pAW1 TaxID=1781155 RepID=A0A1C9U4N9_9BACT|nr:porin [uncultured bacterium pAW1]
MGQYKLGMNQFRSCIMRRTAIVFGLLLLSSGLASAGSLNGEVGFSAGATFPQGDLTRYSDPGPNFAIRGSFYPSPTSAFGLMVDFNGAFFESQTEEFTDDIAGDFYQFEQTVSQYAISLHGGVQFAPTIRGSGFRPRLGVAPGLYIFNTETSLKFKDDDEDIESDSDATTKFGFRGIVGLDVAFSHKWALGFEYVFDRVFSLEQRESDENQALVAGESINADFNTFMLTVTIPFSTFSE